MIFIADLIACSTCFGHHYTHHQELESIMQVVAACRIWCLVFKLSVWCGAEGCVSGLRAAAAANTTGSNHLYNTIELLMMGIMVPETYWASHKICNKNHLLHLVGILFPHTHTYIYIYIYLLVQIMYINNTNILYVHKNKKNIYCIVFSVIPPRSSSVTITSLSSSQFLCFSPHFHSVQYTSCHISIDLR